MTELFIPRRLEELSLAWPPELDHISASSLKMAVRCPEQWRQVYVQGRRVPPNAAMIAGSSDHAAIEMSMVQKVKTYSDLPVYDVQERFITEMDERVGDVGLSDLEVKVGSERLSGTPAKRKEIDRLKREGTNLVGTYHSIVSPTVQPRAVEETFELTPEGFPVKVVGRLDLVASVDNSPLKIIDRKRRGGYSKKPEPEWVVQGRIYQLAREIPHEWHVTYVKNGRIQAGGDDYTIKPDPRWKSEKLLSHIIGEVGYYMMRYGPDEPWPAKGQLHTWACSYCAFRDDKSCWAYKEE